MNVRNIRQIKHNLQIFKNQNDLQESKISDLTHYLSFTMIQVWEHCGVLHELDGSSELLTLHGNSSY